MKQETENTKNKCEQFEEGVLLPGQTTQRTSKVAQNRIHLKQMLERGQTSLRKYLRALGRMTHIVKNKRKHGPALGAASIMREALDSATDDQDGAPPRRARGGPMGRAGGARGRGAAPRYRYVLKSAIFFISTDYLSHRSGFQNMGGPRATSTS